MIELHELCFKSRVPDIRLDLVEVKGKATG